MNINFVGPRYTSTDDNFVRSSSSVVKNWKSSSSSPSPSSCQSNHDSQMMMTASLGSSLPDLLAKRELYGVKNNIRTNTICRVNKRVTSSLLAHQAAWNPRRLQNMILAVGPGTPASVLMNSSSVAYKSDSSASSSSSSSSSSEEEEESSSSASSSGSVVSYSVEERGGGSEREDAAATATTTTTTINQAAATTAAPIAVVQTTSSSGGQQRHEQREGEEENKKISFKKEGPECYGAEPNDDDDDDDEDEDIPGGRRGRRSRWTTANRYRLNDEEEDDDDDDDDDDGNGGDGNRMDAHDIIESALMDWYGADSSGEDDEASSVDGMDYTSQADNNNNKNNTSPSKPVPSMRHGGCINTAAWLDCGWRLSTSAIGGGSLSSPSRCTGVETGECPTQLVTSGDDHLVKFWDVSHAMGTDSPLPGGTSTICPFSSPTAYSNDTVRKEWTDYYKKTKVNGISGSVLPLATLRTGHRGNVFHVTPLKGRPGTVATCGADGYLRLADLETGDSNAVVSPEFEDDIGGLFPAGLLSFRSGMCFSHHFLNQNTGLLCSERGLRRFDLRLPPREQPTRSLFGGPFRACKACAVWSSHDASPLEGGDSAYVFAGGSSADVALGDLRMADGSSSRVIQRYRPSGLMVSDHVSVSGLDLSRDKQELLVSYESDQIYTFPVFPNVKSPSGPTVDEIHELSKSEGNGKVLSELAAYGGHLNRFTFLKNARYAGPQDEYICTGSDSGHAWVYEKSTGAVVSFLNADHSTCNGVIPHPTLPVFVTYGIDSTAKLWRATTPVDMNVDDSAVGRYKCYQENDYEMSPCVRKWDEVHQALRIFSSETCEEIDVPPDAIPGTNSLSIRGLRFGRHFSSRDGAGGRRLGNDLYNLPQILKQNMYCCIRSLVDGDDVPVESDIESLKRRVSVIRLRHQADRLGIHSNPSCPWQLEKPTSVDSGDIHPADLVPDPSDWLPYDPETTKSPWDFSNYFNHSEYGDFYRDRYLPEQRNCRIPMDALVSEKTDKEVSSEDTCSKGRPPVRKIDSSSSEEEYEGDKRSALQALYETMLVLKDGGNLAMHEGKLDLAACRYDKAIQYGAAATMCFPVKHLEYAKDRTEKLKDSDWHVLSWDPTLKLLVVTRLNLALLLLKPYFSQPDQTVEQARLAIDELKPFCSKKGKVMYNGTVHSIDEPGETYIDAMTLQAKAYFRLGSAQYELGENEEAIQSFEQSVKCTHQANSKPDTLVIRRLNEVKKENKRRNKKRRKKFKFAFGGKEN